LLLQAFINSQVRNLTRAANVRMPKPSQCLMVTDIANPSLAAHAGVGLKDFLVSLDGVTAAEISPSTYLVPASSREWCFYSRPRHELITLQATGIEPGITLQPTPDLIRERYNPKTSSPKDLEVLWEARDFRSLEDLSKKTVIASGRDQPALAYLGAALYETGRKAEGIALVAEYADNFAPHWTMNFIPRSSTSRAHAWRISSSSTLERGRLWRRPFGSGGYFPSIACPGSTAARERSRSQRRLVA
jgi:hypothetical protein